MHSPATPEFIFNHDGFSALLPLADTDMTEADAVELLVEPLAQAGFTAIDWCTLTVAERNCRTRHNHVFDGVGKGRDIDRTLGRIMRHYAAQPRDLLDVMVKHGHDRGMKVFGNTRLNHVLNHERCARVPGRMFAIPHATEKGRWDFRDESFHTFLAEVCEDMLGKGVDGLSLDFQRKVPFFPEDATQQERFTATESFLRRIRKLTGKPIVARVAYEKNKGQSDGQAPEAWIKAGLVDAVVPATHNHEPDGLDWPIDRFVDAAKDTAVKIWPQIWPTGLKWSDPLTKTPAECDLYLHHEAAVLGRTRSLLDAGAAGVYLFNFCCCDDWRDRLPCFHTYGDLTQ